MMVKQRSGRSSLNALFVSTLFTFTSFTAFFPVLPLHMKNIGATNFQVGQVMAAFPVGVLLFRPVVSWLLNRKGRRWTLQLGTAVLSLTTLLYFPVENVNGLTLVRLAHGTGLSAFTTASVVLISDLTSFENRGRIMGLMGLANYLGFGLGPFFASLVYRSAAMTGVFACAAVLAAMSFAATLRVTEAPEYKSSRRENGTDKVSIGRWFLVPAAFLFIIAMVQGSIITFLPVYLNERGGFDAGLFFLFFSFSVLLIRIAAGRTSDLYGRGIVIVIASLMILAGLWALSRTSALWMLLLAAFLYGAGYGSQQPAMSALVADNTTFSSRSTLFGIYYAAVSYTHLRAHET